MTDTGDGAHFHRVRPPHNDDDGSETWGDMRQEEKEGNVKQEVMAHRTRGYREEDRAGEIEWKVGTKQDEI